MAAVSPHSVQISLREQMITYSSPLSLLDCSVINKAEEYLRHAPPTVIVDSGLFNQPHQSFISSRVRLGWGGGEGCSQGISSWGLWTLQETQLHINNPRMSCSSQMPRSTGTYSTQCPPNQVGQQSSDLHNKKASNSSRTFNNIFLNLLILCEKHVWSIQARHIRYINTWTDALSRNFPIN